MLVQSVVVLLVSTNVKQENPKETTASKLTRASEQNWARLARKAICCATMLMVLFFGSRPAAAQTFGCSPAMANDIVCENSKPGSQPPNWEIAGSGDSTIQGFATAMSVAQGGTISLKINTNAKAYTIGIFRLGYYQGLGARQVDSVTPSATLPQTQPACATDTTTNLYDCG